MSKEKYQGVKFETVFVNKLIPKHPSLKILKKWCTIFHEKDLAPAYPGGSYGNLSFRTNNNTFIITGTCIGLKNQLDNDSFVEVINCDLSEKKVFVNGIRQPSSESFLHWTIYCYRPDIEAVFHGHHLQITQKANLFNIPVTKKTMPYGTPALAKSIIPLLKYNFFVIREHGFVSLGKNMDEAGKNTLLLLKKMELYS